MNSRASEGIACAVIITLANTLRDFSSAFNTTKSNFYVCIAGTTIGNSRWADLVVASSNYIRHSDEWKETTLKSKKPKNNQIQNVKALVASGLLEPTVWEAKLTYLDLLNHLNSNTWDKLHGNFSAWLEDCLPSHPGYED